MQGTVRKASVSLKLGFAGDDYGYAIDLGLPQSAAPAFGRDPEIKVESLWTGETLSRSSTFAARNGPLVRIRSDAGDWRQVFHNLAPFDSMMTHCSDPREGLELLVLRERMRDWRFYDHLRTDRDAPARRPQVGTYTPVLGATVRLAAALQTIRGIGSDVELRAAIADAFPGAGSIAENDGYFELDVQHGLLRPLRAAELSDGTLRYLLLTAALMSPRPPGLMILNEPETNLHPDLRRRRWRSSSQAARRRSSWSSARHGAGLLVADAGGARQIVLDKQLGETLVQGDERPTWTWPHPIGIERTPPLPDKSGA